jgi:hypothetical protein
LRVEGVTHLVAGAGSAAGQIGAPELHAGGRALMPEISSIVAKNYEDITRTDMQRLAQIERLPVELRPPLPELHYSFQKLVDREWLPSNDADAQTSIDALRELCERERYVGDPTMTKDRIVDDVIDIIKRNDATDQDLIRLGVIDELPEHLQPGANEKLSAAISDVLVRVTDKPNKDITVADLQQLGLLDKLPDSIRPDFPHTDWSFANMASSEWMPDTDLESFTAMKNLRRWALTETPHGIEQLRAMFAAGGDIPDELAWAVSKGGGPLLEQLGVKRDDVLPTLLRFLDRASDNDPDAIVGTLRHIGDLVAEMKPRTPEQRQIQVEIGSLLEVNVKRGEDAEYIDYAEIGTARVKAQMLEYLKQYAN